MKSLAGAVGLASCCLLIALSTAQADEVRLSEAQLDRLTAAGPLFTLNPSFGAVGGQVSTGLLNPAPPPPAPPPPAPPPPPASNQVTISEGPASATIQIPNVPTGSAVNVTVNVFSDGVQSTAGIATQGNITGGANSQFTGGGNSTSVF